MDVRHDDRGAAGGGAAANALAPRDADAGGLALKGAEDEFVLPREIEPGPVEIGEPVKDQRRHVGAVGDQIALALDQRRAAAPARHSSEFCLFALWIPFAAAWLARDR